MAQASGLRFLYSMFALLVTFTGARLAGAEGLRTSGAKFAKFHMAMDRDNKNLMMVQETQPFSAVDPCDKVECGDLKCPAGFLPTDYPGHCCPYCVNPNVGWEAPIVGATGKYGGKESLECPNVWCFPLMCMDGAPPKFTAGNCCQTCP